MGVCTCDQTHDAGFYQDLSRGWLPPRPRPPGAPYLEEAVWLATHFDRATTAQVVPRAGADSKEIVFDAESRRRLQRGINKVADAVAVTLGPRGS